MEQTIHIKDDLSKNTILKDVRILTLNCCLLPKFIYQSEGSDNRVQRAELISKMISRYDIVLLQEVFSTAWTKTWNKIISETPSMEKVFTVKNKCKLVDSGLVVLSKFPIIKHRFIKFKNISLSNIMIDRGFLYTRLQVGDKIVHVINTHLNPNENHIGKKQPEDWRKLQMSEILEYKKNVGMQDDLWIIGGDFNDDKLPFQMLNDYHISLSLTKTPTWHSLTSFIIKSKDDEETCIDYIVTNYKQKNSRVINNLISDHYPVEVVVAL